MRTRSVLALAIASLFCQATFAADIVSSQRSDKFVRVSETESRIKFELCIGSEHSAQCSTIGDEDGYSRKEIAFRMRKMSEEETRNSRINVSIIVGSLATGALIGAIKPVPSTGGAFDLSALVKIWDVGFGTVSAGTVGVAAYMVKRTLIDQSPGAAGTDLGIAGNMAGSNVGFIIPESMDEFVKNLNYALM